jgi:hypothetical protein
VTAHKDGDTIPAVVVVRPAGFASRRGVREARDFRQRAGLLRLAAGRERGSRPAPMRATGQPRSAPILATALPFTVSLDAGNGMEIRLTVWQARGQ